MGLNNNKAVLFEIIWDNGCKPLRETTMAPFTDLNIAVLLYIVLLYMTIYTDKHIG